MKISKWYLFYAVPFLITLFVLIRNIATGYSKVFQDVTLIGVAHSIHIAGLIVTLIAGSSYTIYQGEKCTPKLLFYGFLLFIGGGYASSLLGVFASEIFIK